MSVSLTEQAVVERRKTVTRRLGWKFLKPGDTLTLCRKVMGRKPGEPLVRLAEVEVVDVRRERLNHIDYEDVAREGFPWLSAVEFVDFFAKEMRCARGEMVTRIEWRYLTTGDCEADCQDVLRLPRSVQRMRDRMSDLSRRVVVERIPANACPCAWCQGHVRVPTIIDHTERWTGQTLPAVYTGDPTCGHCNAGTTITLPTVTAVPLFRHGGYGEATSTDAAVCLACGRVNVTERRSVNPRRVGE